MQRKAAVVLTLALALGLGGCASGSSGQAAAAKTHSAVHLVHTVQPEQTRQAAAEALPAHIYYQNQVVILMYHGLGQHAHGDIITPAAFAGEMHALQSAGFRFVTLGQVASFLNGGTIPPNAVTLTFDDGLESVYTYAYPILLRNRIPFATFLIAGRVNTFMGDLSWTQVKAMVGSGLLTVGSHTFNSHGAVASGPKTTGAALTTHIYSLVSGQIESNAHYQARVEGDLVRARKILQLETGQPVAWFAYPFGAYDPAVEQMLLQAGYSYAVTTLGWGTSHYARPLSLPRENAGTPKTTPTSIVNMVLYVAHLTAKDPTYQTPQQWVPIWP
ncbi:MAG: polysaccharide deacetylase family protein [Thermaerobacter sp.]|nr:polysaccharide deacetylase family protein [Thermaerobacter sp.]